jgi:hypothetical protein
MPAEITHLEVAVADREALTLCLALGTLEAMRLGLWPLDAGIWTLGRPVFWEPLERAGVPAEVLAVLQSSDELNALSLSAGRSKAEAVLDQMINTVRSRLAALPEKSWYARWAGGERNS